MHRTLRVLGLGTPSLIDIRPVVDVAYRDFVGAWTGIGGTHQWASIKHYTSAGYVGSQLELVVVGDVHAGMKGSTYFRGVTHRMDGTSYSK